MATETTAAKGRVAGSAAGAMTETDVAEGREVARSAAEQPRGKIGDGSLTIVPVSSLQFEEEDADRELSRILLSGLGILRNEDGIRQALEKLRGLWNEVTNSGGRVVSDELRSRFLLGEVFLKSALARRESRGAHTRTDFPASDDTFRKITEARLGEDGVRILFRETDGIAFDVIPN